MADAQGVPDDRWQQLIAAFDPERNMRAIADLLQNAAAGSEQVLGSMTPGSLAGGSDSAGGSVPPWSAAGFPDAMREAMTQMERSFTQLFEATGRFMVESPLRAANGNGHGTGAPEVVVLDCVGTTSIAVPGAESVPHCSDLRRHDAATVPSSAVRILRSQSFDSDQPTFVVRVDVPADTEPGVYHGQLLVTGLPDFVQSLTVRVLVDETE